MMETSEVQAICLNTASEKADPTIPKLEEVPNIWTVAKKKQFVTCYTWGENPIGYSLQRVA